MKVGYEKRTSLAGTEMRVQRFIAQECWSSRGTVYFTMLFGYSGLFATKQEAWLFAIKVIARHLSNYIF